MRSRRSRSRRWGGLGEPGGEGHQVKASPGPRQGATCSLKCQDQLGCGGSPAQQERRAPPVPPAPCMLGGQPPPYLEWVGGHQGSLHRGLERRPLWGGQTPACCELAFWASRQQLNIANIFTEISMLLYQKLNSHNKSICHQSFYIPYNII